MKNNKIILTILFVVLLSICLTVFGCETVLQKTFSSLQSTSNKTISLASELTQMQAPKYPDSTGSEKNEDFVNLISNSSAEFVVKQADLEESVNTLKNTVNTLDTLVKTLNENKASLDSEDAKTIKSTKTNIETINNNISEKLVDVKQCNATINTEILKVSNSNSSEQSSANVNECYSKIYNAIDYIKTQVGEVNTLINSVMELLNKYSQK